MSKAPRIIGILSIVAGAIMIVAGAATYLQVRAQLADENITVSDDADNFGGNDVTGPLTAYAQADVIKEHALEAGGGLTYAELDREDPVRDTVMDASFLRASLFTSVLAFGVSVLIVGLGILIMLIGVAIMSLDKRGRLAMAGGAPAPPVAAAPVAAAPAQQPVPAQPVATQPAATQPAAAPPAAPQQPPPADDD